MNGGAVEERSAFEKCVENDYLTPSSRRKTKGNVSPTNYDSGRCNYFR